MLRGKAPGVVVEPGQWDKSAAEEPRESHDSQAALSTSAPVLAEQLRSLVLRDGHEYVEAEAPRALAEKILADRSSGVAHETSSSQPSSAPPDVHIPKQAGVVWGADGRAYQPNNTAWPWRTFTFSEVGCSGTMIGPGTMITAAHCVYDTVSNAWLQVYDPTYGGGSNRWPRWSPGVDGRDANAVPYGWIQCYDVSIPTAFVNESSDTSETASQYDYAVIDFTTRCGGRPGDTVGWMGAWIFNESTIESRTTYDYGYPQAAGGVLRYHGSVPNFAGELWGMSAGAGTTYVDFPTWKVKTTIDTSGGQSGSSYWLITDDYYVTAIHHGAAASWNHGRRWDADVYNFVAANSQYPEQNY